MPSTRKLINECWQFSSDKKGFSRLGVFSRLVLAKSLAIERRSKKVFILSGDIQTGKTTSLLNWIGNRNDVHGILTPVVNGKRVFLDIKTKEQFRMEAEEGEKDIISIGRYKFSSKKFEKAKQLIQNAMQKDGWLIIDEIGPLELNGEGFHNVLVEALNSSQQKILLVVRNSILEEVKKRYRISNPVIIKNINAIGEQRELIPG